MFINRWLVTIARGPMILNRELINIDIVIHRMSVASWLSITICIGSIIEDLDLCRGCMTVNRREVIINRCSMINWCVVNKHCIHINVLGTIQMYILSYIYHNAVTVVCFYYFIIFIGDFYETPRLLATQKNSSRFFVYYLMTKAFGKYGNWY